jgi:hypothetical protein
MSQELTLKELNISQQIEKYGRKKRRSKQNKFLKNPLERVRDCSTNESANQRKNL